MITFADSDRQLMLSNESQWTSAKSYDAGECSIRRMASVLVANNYSPYDSLKSQLLDEISLQVKKYSQPNWDGYDALPANIDSAAFALRIISDLEEGFPMPVIGTDPEGEITFEWIRDNLHSVSVSVSGTGMLHYASIHGEQISHGKIKYRGFSSLSEISPLISKTLSY